MLAAVGFATEKNTQLMKTRQKDSPNWQFGRSTTLRMLSQLSWETTEGNSAGRIVLRTEHKTVIVCWECAKENQTTDEMRFVSHPTGFRGILCRLQKMSHPLQNLSQLKFNQPPRSCKKASLCIPTKDGLPEAAKHRGRAMGYTGEERT